MRNSHMKSSRRILSLLITSLVVGLFWTCRLMECRAEEPRRPNIILVFIDDMGWEDFSCFGNQKVQTEHIDRLASEGIRFEQFYVNSPICSPSRTAISTGQYPQRWRITSYLAHRSLNEDRGVAKWLDPESTDARPISTQCRLRDRALR